MNLEIVIEKINNKNTKDISYKLEVANQKEYFLEIIGDTITNSEIRVVN